MAEAPAPSDREWMDKTCLFGTGVSCVVSKLVVRYHISSGEYEGEAYRE